MFNEGNEKRWLPVLSFFLSAYAQYPDPFYRIRFKLCPQIGVVALGDVLYILRLNAFQRRHVKIVIEKLRAENRIAKYLLAADIPIMPFSLLIPR